MLFAGLIRRECLPDFWKAEPKQCKFPIAVDRVELTEAIEILDVTPEAQKSIKEVPVWEE